MVTEAEPNYCLSHIDSDWENFSLYRVTIYLNLGAPASFVCWPGGHHRHFHRQEQGLLRSRETGTHEAAAFGNGLDRPDEIDCRIGFDDIPARAGRQCNVGNGF